MVCLKGRCLGWIRGSRRRVCTDSTRNAARPFENASLQLHLHCPQSVQSNRHSSLLLTADFYLLVFEDVPFPISNLGQRPGSCFGPASAAPGIRVPSFTARRVPQPQYGILMPFLMNVSLLFCNRRHIVYPTHFCLRRLLVCTGVTRQSEQKRWPHHGQCPRRKIMPSLPSWHCSEVWLGGRPSLVEEGTHASENPTPLSSVTTTIFKISSQDLRWACRKIDESLSQLASKRSDGVQQPKFGRRPAAETWASSSCRT